MAHLNSGQQIQYIATDDDSMYADIKQEPGTSYGSLTGEYSHSDNLADQYIVDDYTIQQPGGSTYTIVGLPTSTVTTLRQNTSVKNQHSNIIKTTTKVPKYISGSGELQTIAASQKTKPALNTVQNTPINRRRKPEKAGRGLRHFSMRVCEKVKEKGTTTYNEVADELVKEEVKEDSANCDQKNIRRRVYDALNVLMAINIISKDKKEIRWLGLPTNSVEQYNDLLEDHKKRKERCAAKQEQLNELLLQMVSVKKLIERNKEAENQGIIPTANSSIPLPFIIANTNKSTRVNCSVTNDKSEYFFKFNNEFEINDDVVVLKRMGLLLGLDKGECSPEDIENAKALVPKNFEKYIEALGTGVSVEEVESNE